MSTVLWHIEVSHYNEKARWALDYKGIPYALKVPMPGLHGIRAFVLTRGAGRRLPVLQLDGRCIGDSTAIIAALEAHTPEPALYPADLEPSGYLAGDRFSVADLTAAVEEMYQRHRGSHRAPVAA